MHKYSFVFLTVFLFIFCTSNKKPNDNRVELIKRTVSSIKEYDTLQLYNIIDTNYSFDIYGKEGFINLIDIVNNELKTCKADYEGLKSTNTIHNTTIYSLPFCKKESSKADNNYFLLNFTFPNYNSDKQIMFIDIRKELSNIDSSFPSPRRIPK